MNLGKILGGFGMKLSPVDLLKTVLGLASPAAGRAAFGELFKNRMNAAGRVALGDVLVKCGSALREGRVSDATDAAGEAVGLIRL